MKISLRFPLLLAALTSSLLTSCTPTDDDVLPVPPRQGDVHIAPSIRRTIDPAPFISPASSLTGVGSGEPVAKPVCPHSVSF